MYKIELFDTALGFAAAAPLRGDISLRQDYLTLEMLPNYKKYPDMSAWSGKHAVDLIAQMCEK